MLERPLMNFNNHNMSHKTRKHRPLHKYRISLQWCRVANFYVDLAVLGSYPEIKEFQVEWGDTHKDTNYNVGGLTTKIKM